MFPITQVYLMGLIMVSKQPTKLKLWLLDSTPETFQIFLPTAELWMLLVNRLSVRIPVTFTEKYTSQTDGMIGCNATEMNWARLATQLC